MQRVEKGQLSSLSSVSLSQFLLFLLCACHPAAVHSLLICLCSGELHCTFHLTVGVLPYRWVPPNPSFSTEPSPWPSFTFAVLGMEQAISNTLDNLSFFVGVLVNLILQDRVSLYFMLSWNLHYRADWRQTQFLPPECKGEGVSHHPPTWLGVSFLHLVATLMSVCFCEFDFYCGSRHGMEHISFRDNWFDLVGFWGKVLDIA